MKNLIRTDIGCFIRSKVLLGLVILFGLFMVAASWLSFQFCRDSLIEYQKMHDYLLSINADISEEKELDYIIHDNGVIENPLSYDIEQVENSLANIIPKNNITLWGESCTLFLPIIAFLVGIVLVSYDEKNKTLKLKVTNYGKQKVNISKLISGMIILGILMIAAFLVIKVSSLVMYSKIQKEFDISTFSLKVYRRNKLLPQLLFTVCSAAIYFVLGYCISNILHCYTILAVAISIISLFLPSFFRYDFVNVKNTVERRFFDFNGVVSVGEGFPLSLWTAAIEIGAIVLICVIINFIVVRKRSAYA